MLGEVGSEWEGFVTAFALVRKSTCMNEFMDPDVALMHEMFATGFATVWSFVLMEIDEMSGERGSQREHLVALGA